MWEARRPAGRLFCLLLLAGSMMAHAATPATTTIQDVVYRADGTPAGGTLLIAWPTFSTVDGMAVVAGTKSVLLGPGGALSVDLVPNLGASPAGTYYTVVFQLNDGTAKTEYWVVPATSPTTIAAVRTTPGASSAASQMATRQYVDAAVSAKASDAVVVHTSGAETISGAKQFSTPPSVPAPVSPADAVNKQYVDTMVGNVGAGSYVSKAGDTMSGPLMLPGDPTAPNHASTKHYVDLGLAARASLVGGMVPVGQLGSGSADQTTCLKGDSSWGPCGSSSNAIALQNVPLDPVAPTDGQVITYEAASGKYKPKAGGNSSNATSIQNVAVDTTPPSDNQVITYEASSGKYKPKAGGGVSAGMQAIKYATDFNWSQSPTADLSTAGNKTVSLSACGGGVKGTEAEYYAYIAGTGTPEAVKVTGGTCNGDGQPGTLQFTTANPHAAGYTIGSASGGLQEASIAARVLPNGATAWQAGKVIAPPGDIKAYARISIRSSNQTIDFSGSIIECYMADSCVFVGDPSNATAYNDITFINPRGRPMVVGGSKPFIEVNAQKTRLFNVTTRVAASGAYFSSYVQVDGDEAFLLDGLDTTLGGSGGNYSVRCDATVCNPVVYAPGPFGANGDAVGWLKNLNISLQCKGNGVDWQSGNTLNISDSVIQGFAQYGVRAGTRRGGFGGFELNDVYEEVGSCTNPAGNIGEAGVIAQGSTVKIGAGESPTGALPQFANTGSTDYRYYIVAHHGSYGASNPLYAGRALTNGSGNITVTAPDIAGASSFDLLRVTYVAAGAPREQAPYGTGNYAVVSSVSRAAACANGVCSFTDTQAPLQSYSVATPAYFPLLDFWPGNLVLSADQDSNSALTAATASLDTIKGGIVAVQGTQSPAVMAHSCAAVGWWTPLWLSCLASSYPPATFAVQGATILAVKPNADGGLWPNLKGRLNFSTLGTGPGHIITLSDSNFQKTIATANNRPTSDIYDAYIGYDAAGSRVDRSDVGISFGAPASLTNYIGNVGDGTNWKERLTATLKEFKTDVQIDGNLTVAGALQSTGAGPWSIEGSYGTMATAASGKSKLGFGPNGKVSVSENAGTVMELAKKLPQQFTYTFFDPNNPLTMSLQVPSVYVNRAAALHIVEVYCEIDAGSASINLQTAGANILSSDLACSTGGATSSAFASGKDAVAVGQKINHVTVSTGAGLHRMNVVVKYTVD
jgi:hypothetical protein